MGGEGSLGRRGPIDVKTDTPGAPKNPQKLQDSLQRSALGLIGQTAPLRTGLIDRGVNFLDGGLDVTASPQFAAMQNAANQQFSRARDNILSTTAPGGALTDALAQAELGRADTLTQGAGAIAGDEINRALQLASGGFAQGANTAGQIQATQAAARAAERQSVISAKKGGGGGGASSLGQAIGGK